MVRKLEYKFIKDFINSKGCFLISETYKNSNDKLDVKCKCGKIFKISFKQFKNSNFICKECSQKLLSDKQRYSYEFVYNYIKSKGCELLSEKYKNCKEDLKIKCKCGEIYYTNFDKFKNSNSILCPNCSDKGQYKKGVSPLNKHDDYWFKSALYNKDKNLKSLSTYKSMREKVKVKHLLCGHVWWTTPDTLINKNRGCPNCNTSWNSRLSNKVEQFLKDNNIKFLKEYKFAECRDKKPLPFDFYLIDLNILIEVDGIQHFKKPFYIKDEIKKTKKLEITQLHDKIKNKFCEDNKINLIRIPYYLEENDEYLNILNNMLILS